MRNEGTKTRLRLYLSNSTEATDGGAQLEGHEVLSKLLGDTSWPRREPTPTFLHRATGQYPTPDSSEQIETRDPVYAQEDPSYMSREGRGAFMEAKQGFHRERNSRMKNWMKGVAVLGSIAALVLAIVMTGLFSGGGVEEPTNAQTPAVQPTPTLPPILPQE